MAHRSHAFPDKPGNATHRVVFDPRDRRKWVDLVVDGGPDSFAVLWPPLIAGGANVFVQQSPMVFEIPGR